MSISISHLYYIPYRSHQSKIGNTSGLDMTKTEILIILALRKQGSKYWNVSNSTAFMTVAYMTSVWQSGPEKRKIRKINKILDVDKLYLSQTVWSQDSSNQALPKSLLGLYIRLSNSNTNQTNLMKSLTKNLDIINWKGCYAQV